MATGYWDGATNGLWSAVANWNTTLTGAINVTVVPGAADIAYFNNNAVVAARTVYLNGSRSVGQIVLNSNNRDTTLIGGTSATPAAQTLTLGSSGVDASGSSANWLNTNSNLTLALTSANTPFNIASTNASYLDGPITGSGFGVRKTGAGHLVWRTTNKTYTGRTWVNGGTLYIDVGLSLPSAGGEALLIDNGAGVVIRTSQVYGTASNNYVWNISNGVLFGDVGNQTMPATLNMTFPAFLRGGSTDTSGAFVVRTGLNSTINGEHVISATIGIQTGAVLTFNQSSGQTMEVSGVLGASAANAGSVVKNGVGTLTLSARNTFTGGTTVNAGTLNLNAGNDVDPTVRGALTVVSGATAKTTSQNALYGSTTATATFVTVQSGGNFDFGDDSTGFQSIGSTFTIQGATITGNKTGTAAVHMYQSNAKVVASGTNTWAATPTRFLDGALGIEVTSGNTTWSGIINDLNGSLDSVLIKNGSGTLTLTGANTFTKGFTLNAGTVNLGVAQVASTSGPLGASGTITMPSAGTGRLQYSAANQHDYSSRFSTAASQRFAVDTNGQNVTWASDITSSGATIDKFGSGTLTVSGNNTGFGNSSVLYAGTLSFGSDTALGSTSVLQINGGAIDTTAVRSISNILSISSSFEFVGSYNFSISGYAQLFTSPTITVTASTLTFNGAVIESGGSRNLTKAGAGKLTLTSASNLYTGTTTISAGTLEISGNGLIDLTGVYASNIFNSGTLSIATSASQILSGVISGVGGVVTKSSTGTLTLSGANTYDGGTTLSQGGLTLGNNSALGTGTFTISGGTVDVTAARSITNALSIGGSFTFTGSNTLTQGTGLITLTASPVITVSASTLTLNAIISGAFALSKAGGGTLTLGAFNTYNGNTTVNDGMLRLSTGGSTGCIRGTVTLTAGSTLETTVTDALGYSSTAANRVTDVSLTGATFNNASSGNQGYYTNFTLNGATVTSTGTGKINFYTGRTITGSGSNTWSAPTRIRTEASNTLTVSISSGTTTMSGVVSEGNGSGVLTAFTGGLTKTGAGVLALTTANTYRGTTTVSQGTLKAGNTAALGTGAASVASGATLQALASISGRLNIGGNLTNSGGTLRIGGT